jgi:hypothetical protein
MLKYYFIKTAMLITYSITAIYCWWFFLAPVIAMYGWGRMLVVFIGTFFICMATSFMFFATRKPQATHKSPSWTSEQAYQAYLNSLTTETIDD